MKLAVQDGGDSGLAVLRSTFIRVPEICYRFKITGGWLYLDGPMERNLEVICSERR
jgi:hypothetical protein